MTPSKGKLLVSEPSILNDQSFNRSIIYLTEYNDNGCIGFILNKPIKFLLKDLIPEINCNFQIFNGGPVNQENLYFVHRKPALIPNSIEIGDGIFWGGDFEVLTELLNQDKLKQSEIRFFLGYSGWTKNQLQEELKETSWVVIDNKFPNILSIKSNGFWKNQMLKFGGEYQIWANAPKNPTLN